MKLHVWFLGTLVCGSIVTAQQAPSPQVEWLYYGGDQSGTKFSPLADVNIENVDRLKIAWQWSHFDVPRPDMTSKDGISSLGTIPMGFQNTPLMRDGVLYVTTPYGNAASIDAETGKELWRHDAQAFRLGPIPASGTSIAAARSGVTAKGSTSSSTRATVSSVSTSRRGNPSTPSATTGRSR